MEYDENIRNDLTRCYITMGVHFLNLNKIDIQHNRRCTHFWLFRVSACLISMLLIVYGSFRSLNMEREARERAEREREATLLGGKPAPSCSHNSSKFTTHLQKIPLALCISLCLPLFLREIKKIMFSSRQYVLRLCQISSFSVQSFKLQTLSNKHQSIYLSFHMYNIRKK